MRTIRCSSLPRLFACAPSLDGDLQIDARNEAADLGSAAHEAMEAVVTGHAADLDAIAQRWTCNRDELGRIAWYGKQAWGVLAPSFVDAETEVEVGSTFDGFKLTGHVDLRSQPAEREAAILDWKTGRVDGDHYHQLAGYAACLVNMGRYDKVTASVVWLRAQDIETYVITADVVDQWLARLRAQLAKTTYSTGRHCETCPRSHSCPAVAAKAREAVALLRDPPADLTALSSAEVVSLYRQARLLEKVADEAVKAIRLHVVNCGPQDSGDGTALQIVEENAGRDIDVAKAWDIIQARLPEPEQMASVLKVSASALDDAVAKAAGQGKGAAAKRELAAELEAAGAVTMRKVSKLSEKRLPKEIEQS